MRMQMWTTGLAAHTTALETIRSIHAGIASSVVPTAGPNRTDCRGGKPTQSHAELGTRTKLRDSVCERGEAHGARAAHATHGLTAPPSCRQYAAPPPPRARAACAPTHWTAASRARLEGCASSNSPPRTPPARTQSVIPRTRLKPRRNSHCSHVCPALLCINQGRRCLHGGVVEVSCTSLMLLWLKTSSSS
jgi:hypothetical protein